MGNPDTYTEVLDTTVDADGNTYISGDVSGTLDFDPANVHSGDADILATQGDTSGFVAKYAADGSFLWVRSIDDSGSAFATALATDAAGNVFVTGYSYGVAQFGGITLPNFNEGSADIFVAKLDTAGNFAWAHRLGGNTHDLRLRYRR